MKGDGQKEKRTMRRMKERTMLKWVVVVIQELSRNNVENGSMNTTYWNCQGLGFSVKIRQLKDLARGYQSDIICLA